MPLYPGVYVEERPTGVRPIEGVPTSTTAFVGRALRGPTHHDKAKSPVAINCYGEFERIFGGLWSESTLGFAVRDFFLNGGNQALIVRVYKARRGRKSVAKLKAGPLTLKASSPGAWGAKLRVRIDHATRTRPAFRAEAIAKLFNLTVKDMQTGQIELFRDISVARNHPRHVAKVLEQESTLVKVEGKVAATVRPRAHAAVTAGDPDPFSDRFKKRYAVVSSSDLPDDGLALTRRDVSAPGLKASETGLDALLRVQFNLLCIPPLAPNGATESEADLADDAIAFCEKRRAFFIIDPPWHRGADVATAMAGIKRFAATIKRTNHAALYFPTIVQPNPLHGGQREEFAPCGAVAGIIARTDAQRGVWKAPAGLEATLEGVPQLSVTLGDRESAELNSLGINCLRTFSGVRHVVWGARTIEGNDQLGSEWKYVPVRRMALFIEESLSRGTQWVVFEPNDESLWAEVRLSVGAFLQNLFRQGAFQGRTPREAYFVKCDQETTTQTDINQGFVNILVGFAPLKPAEFVVIRLTQMAGQTEVNP